MRRATWHGSVLGVVSAMAAATGCGGDDGPPPEIGCPGDPVRQPPGLDPALEARVDAVMAAMTLDDKLGQLSGFGAPVNELWVAAENERLGLPGFHMIDGPRGVYAGKSTCFPVGMARGATFDPALEREVGEAIALEAAGKGAAVILAPTINVLRHPAWGRAQETYGEDTHHLGVMGSAFVDGAQRHVVATVKHFAANSIEDTRFDVSVEIEERPLREVYLPHFAKVVREAKVGAVMSAYNKVNGVYAGEHRFLLRDVLKDEWDFPGMVMSDWVFGTRSAAPAVNAGLDLEMPARIEFARLGDAVASCELTRSVLDDAVRRVVRTQLRFGLDARPPVDPSVVESPAHAALALKVARQSIVLLRNQGGALPLAATGSGPIAVVGALAGVAEVGDEGSSEVNPSRAVTPLDGLRTRFGADQVVHVDGDVLDEAGRDQVAAARAAIVVVGLTSRDEGENFPDRGGDRDTLALSAAHQTLIGAVAAANPHTIVVVEGGSAILTSPWIEDVEAVLMAWYPGQEGGTAIAEIIAGDVNPSGRLPISFPVAEADLPPFDHVSLSVPYGLLHGYRWLDRNDTAPAFPLGFGLSYGTVEYETVTLASTALTPAGEVQATVTIRGVDRTGAEVVQLYVEPPPIAIERAVRDLRAFARVAVTPGQTTTATLTFPVADLARFDASSRTWVVDPGTYTVAVGRDARDLPLRATFTVAP